MRHGLTTTLLLALTYSSEALAWYDGWGPSIGYGLISVSSEEANEISKDGSTRSFGLLFENRLAPMSLKAGFGLQQSQVRGQDELKGLEQFYKINNLYLNAGLEINVFGRFYLGGDYHLATGKGTNFGVEDGETVKNVALFGPSISYQLNLKEKFDLLLHISHTVDLADRQRKIVQDLLSLTWIYSSDSN